MNSITWNLERRHRAKHHAMNIHHLIYVEIEFPNIELWLRGNINGNDGYSNFPSNAKIGNFVILRFPNKGVYPHQPIFVECQPRKIDFIVENVVQVFIFL